MCKMKIGVVGLGRQGPSIDEIINNNLLNKSTEPSKFDPYISGNRLFMPRIPNFLEVQVRQELIEKAERYFDDRALALFCEGLTRGRK